VLTDRQTNTGHDITPAHRVTKTVTLAVIDDWLSGLPVNVTVKSDREAVNSDSHRLSWTVHSLSPLISHQLQLQVASESVSTI